METIVHLVFGTGPDLTTWQMAARGAGMFVIALAMVRLSGRRSFGLRTPFDSCTTVLLGAILSRAVVGASDFWPTVAGAAALVLMHRLTGMASVRWPWLEQLVDGRERELVRAGQVDEAELRKALVTRHDLREALRRRTGSDDLARVDKVILEPNGEITVLMKS